MNFVENGSDLAVKELRLELPPLSEWLGGGDGLAGAPAVTERRTIRFDYALNEGAQWALAGVDGVCLSLDPPSYIKLSVCGESTFSVNLEVKFLDERGNVFLARLDGVALERRVRWLEIEPADIRYGWGPDGAHEPRMIRRLEVAVSRFQEDTVGWIEFGEWSTEPLDDPAWYRETLACRINRCRGLIGWENCGNKVPVSRAGTVASDDCRFMIHTWFYDHQDETLITPETMQPIWRMEECGVPIYHIEVKNEHLSIETILFAYGDADGVDVYSRTYITNVSQKTRNVSVLRLIQPNSLVSNSAVTDVVFDGKNRMRVNGNRYLTVEPQCESYQQKFAEAERKGRAVFLGPDHEAVRNRSAMAAQDVVILSGHTVAVDYVLPRAGREFPEISLDDALAKTRFHWLKRVPLRMSLPDQSMQDMFYASIHYQLMMMHDEKLCPGPRDYKRFFLHDAVDMINSLNMAGLQPLVRRALRHFVYGVNGEDKLYFDGIGGCIFARYEYYRFSGDRAYLKAEFKTMIGYARRLVELLSENRTQERKGSEFYGLMPPSKSQDNWNYPAHLYVDNWWTLIGLKSALETARVLEETESVSWLKTEVSRFNRDLINSMNRVCEREGTEWIPGFADVWGPEMRVVDAEHRILGDAQMAWAHRPAMYPGQSLGLDLPEKRLADSYKKYWRDAGRFSGYDGGWFVEYEKVFWGYNAKLAYPMMAFEMPDVALQNINWLLQNQSAPLAWMEAMPARQNVDGCWKVDTSAGIIGDVPHGWSAAHIAIFIRSMLFREVGDRLHLFSAIPSDWLCGGRTVSVEQASTVFGTLSFSLTGYADDGYVKLTLDASGLSDQCRGISLHIDKSFRIGKVRHSVIEDVAPEEDGQVLLPVKSGTVILDTEYRKTY